MALDTQVNLAESDKVSFYNQKEWLEEYEHGKGMFYTEYSQKKYRRCSVKKGVLTNSTKFTGKHLCHSLFFNKVAALRPATSLKKRLWHRCFPVNFAKFPRTPPDDCFCTVMTSGRLLLYFRTNLLMF